MKFFSSVVSLLIIFGCGIMTVLFGLPERYIERDVNMDEMVGTWSVTPESESYVNSWVNRHYDWGIIAPWRSFMLNGDGSCKIEIQTDWLDASYSKLPTANMTSCSWTLDKERNPSNKISPVLELTIEYPNNYGGIFSLYIFEENGGLIVWNFIGDPDDFLPQDFVKLKQ